MIESGQQAPEPTHRRTILSHLNILNFKIFFRGGSGDFFGQILAKNI